MDVSATLDPQSAAMVKAQVNAFNQVLGGVDSSTVLDKNDFLKLLITQLTHQDPTEPMQDREFIAQMAQFSTLEQITNMSQDFSKLAGILSTSQAMGLLGKNVEVLSGTDLVSGIVQEVAGRESPRLLINGKYYDYESVTKVME